MQRIFFLAAVLAIASLVGCSHSIVITPDVSQLSRGDIKTIDLNVGYYISTADREKQVTTPGGGGDKVSYFPYKEIEPALFKVLSNTFRRAYPLKAANDAEGIKANDITFVFIPEIQTDSSSDSLLTWPPTDFTVTMLCKAVDANGKLLWEKRFVGTGKATFSEFKTEFSLAARRASLKVLDDFQKEVNNAPELRK